MTFAQHLQEGTVLINPIAGDKWTLLEQIVENLSTSGTIPQQLRHVALEALVARETNLSTGMEDGVAVPHAALEGLESLTCGIAILPQGLEFDSLDGKPARIVVTLLVFRARHPTIKRLEGMGLGILSGASNNTGSIIVNISAYFHIMFNTLIICKKPCNPKL